jgi:hypothetical protein
MLLIDMIMASRRIENQRRLVVVVLGAKKRYVKVE